MKQKVFFALTNKTKSVILKSQSRTAAENLNQSRQERTETFD